MLEIANLGDHPDVIGYTERTRAANERRAPLSTKDRESGANMTGFGALREAVERRGRASGGEQRFKDEEGAMVQKHL